MSRPAVVLLALVLCSGCQTSPSLAVDPYRSDSVVREKLAAIGDVKLAMAEFDSVQDGWTTADCRHGPISLPGSDSIADYIRQGLMIELETAGLYDAAASTVVSGNLTKMRLRFDGRIGHTAIGATWFFSLQLESSNGASLSVESASSYRTGWDPIDCSRVAASLMPAVQKLLREAVSHPGFASLAGGHAGADVP